MGIQIKRIVGIATLALFFSTVMAVGNAMALDKITVGYYPGWPCSYQVGQAKGWFDKELGIKVNFREFDHPSQMATAIASGDCHIAYSLGAIPFTSGVSQGVPYILVGIAVSYAENDNCVARNGTGIRSPRDLIGKKVGVPFSSVSHYKLLATLKIFGVDSSKLKIYDMAPQDLTAAMMRKDLDCGCAWEPALSAMLEDGHLIVSAEDQERWGLKVFDIVVSGKKFAKKHPEVIVKFLKVVDESTRYYRKNPEESYRLIAKLAGLEPEKAKNILKKMKFFTKKEQLSPEWMGTKKKPGDVVNFISEVAKFLYAEKSMDKVLDDYNATIDQSFYEAVK